MQNPLEKFLLNLAEKIQTEKEYKDIVNNSQTVDVNKNVFEGFIAGVAETIKKELKERTTVVPVSAVEIVPEPKPEEDSFVKFVSTLASTISANKNNPAEIKPTEEAEEKQTKTITSQEPEPEPLPEPDSFEKFLGNLKDIIQKAPAEKPKETPKKETKPNDYVSELKKESEPKETTKLKTKDELIKDLVRKFVENEIKNFKDEVTLKINQVGSAYGGGGGTNAVQYANGGTMNGNLNVNGQILSGGIDLANIFGSGSNVNLGDIPVLSGNWNSTYSTVYSNSGSWGTGGIPQTLSFNENNALLSLSFGNTISLSALSGTSSSTGDSAVNSLVHNNSAYWNEAYTNLVNNSAAYLLSGTKVNLGDIPTLSGYWNDAYTNLVNNSAAYLLSGTEVSLGDIPLLSAYWNEAYTNLVTNSAAYLLSGTEVNLGDIPTLSANWNESYTNLIYNSAAYLSGVDISLITTSSGSWNSVYSSFNTNSAEYDSAYTTTNTNSAFWSQAYTNLVNNSSAYLSAISLGDIPTLSASWNSVYSNVNSNSSYYALTNASVTFTNNVTINGNLTALGTSTFANTIFTTTSALSVINNGAGPALYVSQSPGNFDVASFYDQDGIEVLHVGNAPTPGTLAKVGINESYPSTELTVRGAISASYSITVLNGNSNQWNSVYSSFNANSAKYDSNYTTTNNNSASWSSIYTTVNSNSATTWNYQGTDIKSLTGKWDSNYTTTNNNSAFWNQAYTNLVTNSAGYLLSGTSVSLGDIPILSAGWNSNYSTTNSNSATWTTAYTNLVTNSATYLGTTRQFDYVQVGLNSYSYCGYAVPGTSTSSTGWTIKRLYFSTAGTLLSSGTVTNSVWNSRYSYNY